MEVGDLIFAHEQPTAEGNCVERVQDIRKGRLLRAHSPGIGKLTRSTGWSAFVRVSRRGFVGRSLFRHLEEIVDEGSDDC